METISHTYNELEAYVCDARERAAATVADRADTRISKGLGIGFMLPQGVYPVREDGIDPGVILTASDRVTVSRWNGGPADESVESLIRTHVETLLSKGDPVTLAHCASLASFLIVTVPDGQAGTEEIVIDHRDAAGAVAVIVSVGKRARVRVHEKIRRQGADIAFSCSLSVHCSEGSDARFTTFADIRQDETVVSRKMASVAGDASLFWTEAVSGEGRLHSMMTTSLNGRNARVEDAGIYRLDGTGFCEAERVCRHAAEKTVSSLRCSATLDGAARLLQQGKTVIEPAAADTKADQRTAALLMSGNAEADAMPELEVGTDAVESGHAVSIGRLDSDRLFYLMSHGIDERSARAMLSEGFLVDAASLVIDSERAAVEDHFHVNA